MLAACLVAAAACGSPTRPTARLGESFTLAPGEQILVAGTSTRLTFVAVLGDSRCPADAVCILGGDAVVRVEARQSAAGASTPLDLHTAGPGSVRYRDLTIALVALAPYPFSASPIDPDDYRATLEVTR